MTHSLRQPQLFGTDSAVQRCNILLLSPDLDERHVGGIQASGREAWAGLSHTLPAGRAHLFSVSLPDASSNPVSRALAKAAPVAAALRRRGRQQQMLFWHIGLLKLLPFFQVKDAHVSLFLHGVEVWRRHDPLTRLLLRRVNLFLSNSDYTWGRFLTCYPELRGKTHQTVHLGLGTATSPTPWNDGPPAALIVGRMARGEDYKGHRELIGAWQAVRKQVPAAELWVAGDGDLRPELETLARTQKLQDSVRFFGRVSEDQKQRLLSRCRCLAMPSSGEGFGLVYLEAMRVGRPCIVSNADAGREVVNPPEAGLAVDPRHSEALAAALTEILQPGQKWMHWSEQAWQRYKREFTAAHFQQRLIKALYSDLAHWPEQV